MIENCEQVFRETEVLPGERITLRRFREEDCWDVLEFGSDEQTVQYLVWDGLSSLDGAKAAIRDYYLSRPGIYAIELAAERKCIGCISTELEAAHEKASFGYVLNRGYWNRGYATEALRAVLDFLFGRLELNRVEATHYTGNEGSGRVMEKCGMVREGLGRKEVKIKGIFRDVIHYGILREDWAAR